MRRDGKYSPTIHVVDTEARTLDDALAIIAARNRRNNISKARKNPQNLRQQLGLAKAQSVMDKMRGKISLAGGKNKPTITKSTKLPHPFRDLPDDKKRLKARELFGSGYWGFGIGGTRRLATAFGVTMGQMVIWLEDCERPPL